MAQIFISYSSKDKEWVSSLAKHLESDNFDIWWDRKLNTGSSFLNEINDELEKSSIVLVVWSASSLKSTWVQGELQEALESGKQIIPIYWKKIKLQVPYNTFHALNMEDWSGEKDNLYNDLKSALNKAVQLSKKAVEENAFKLDASQINFEINIRGKDYHVSPSAPAGDELLENLLSQLEQQRELINLAQSQMKKAFIDQTYLFKPPMMVNFDTPTQQAIISHLTIQKLIPAIQQKGGEAQFSKPETFHVKQRVEIMRNVAERIAHMEKSKPKNPIPVALIMILVVSTVMFVLFIT